MILVGLVIVPIYIKKTKIQLAKAFRNAHVIVYITKTNFKTDTKKVRIN